MPLPKKPMGAFLQFKSDQLGNKWQELDKQEQQRFTDAYEADKANGVARPKSAYFRFVDEQQLSQKWAALAPSEKQRYQSNYAMLQKQYLDGMAQYDAIYGEKASRAPPLPDKGKQQAFLHYGADMRAKRLPELQGKTQQEVNTLLGQMWAALGDEERRPYVDIAQREREAYDAQIRAYELEWGALEYIAKQKANAAAAAAAASADASTDASTDASYSGDVDCSDEIDNGSDNGDGEIGGGNGANDEIDESGDNNSGEDAGKRKLAPTARPRAKKVQRVVDAQDVLAAQQAKAQRNLIAAHDLYCRHMLQSELDKFTRKATRGKTPPANLVFNCDAVVAEIKQRWEKLSDRTRANWVNQVTRKVYHHAAESDDDNASIPTPDEQTEDGDFDDADDDADSDDDGEDKEEEEDEEVDEEESEDEGEEGKNKETEEEPKCEEDDGDDEDEGEVDVIGDDEDDSRENDLANYGDDGDDFVCGDDEIEYEDGLTSEEIREAQEKEKALHAALSIGYGGGRAKKGKVKK